MIERDTEKLVTIPMRKGRIEMANEPVREPVVCIDALDHWPCQLGSLPLGEPIKGETLRADGWVYRDIPGRLSHEMWDYLLGIIGNGNYRVLGMAVGDDWKRGQLMISPDGMKNLAAFKLMQ